jgi:hypothetical protein
MKTTKKRGLDNILLKICLIPKSPSAVTLKNLNKNINKNKILLAISIEVAAKMAGLRPLEIKYFSKTGALERLINAINAKTKPIHIKPP